VFSASSRTESLSYASAAARRGALAARLNFGTALAQVCWCVGVTICALNQSPRPQVNATTRRHVRVRAARVRIQHVSTVTCVVWCVISLRAHAVRGHVCVRRDASPVVSVALDNITLALNTKVMHVSVSLRTHHL
jgi:hypothetical protein